MPDKLFISHASEDKDEFVRPLAEALEKEKELKVWYDEYELKLGDSLLFQIGEGLKSCDYGIVVLSNHFFAKDWTQRELQGLYALETQHKKVILPIWKDVTKEQVTQFLPMLADRVAANASEGIPRIIDKIKQSVGLADRVASFSTASAIAAKLKSLEDDVAHQISAKKLFESIEGVKLVLDAAKELIAQLGKRFTEFQAQSSLFKFKIDQPPQATAQQLVFSVSGPWNVRLHLEYRNPIVNSTSEARLTPFIYQAVLDPFGQQKSRRDILRITFHPLLDRESKVIWGDNNKKTFTRNALCDFLLEQYVGELEKTRDAAAR